MAIRSEQEIFWQDKYSLDYIQKNKDFNLKLGVEAWNKIINVFPDKPNNFLECGCNIGRNIEQLSYVLPEAKPSIIEISPDAYSVVTQRFENLEYKVNKPILEASLPKEYFELVYTIGVLIHINPEQLIEHMCKMYDFSSKYILMGEYFNRTPVSLVYQGEKERLFKRDFGKLFIENFNVKLIDYGFLWGHIYDAAGFDDITWWLFEKV